MNDTRIEYLGFEIEVRQEGGRHVARVAHPEGKEFSAKGAGQSDYCLVSFAETVFLPTEAEALTEGKIIADSAKMQ